MAFTAFDTPDHNVLHLLLDHLPLLHAEPLRELAHLPHGLLSIVLLGVLLDAVVGEMGKSVVDVIEGVFVVGEAEVALVVEPNGWRREVLDGHPLADVELPAFDEERVFDVLLHDKLGGLAEAVVSDVVDIIEASYSSSSRHNYITNYLQLGLAIHTFLMPLISNCGSFSYISFRCFLIFSSNFSKIFAS